MEPVANYEQKGFFGNVVFTNQGKADQTEGVSANGGPALVLVAFPFLGAT